MYAQRIVDAILASHSRVLIVPSKLNGVSCDILIAWTFSATSFANSFKLTWLSSLPGITFLRALHPRDKIKEIARKCLLCAGQEAPRVACTRYDEQFANCFRAVYELPCFMFLRGRRRRGVSETCPRRLLTYAEPYFHAWICASFSRLWRSCEHRPRNRLTNESILSWHGVYGQRLHGFAGKIEQRPSCFSGMKKSESSEAER